MLAGWAEPEQTRPLVQLREDPEGFRMSIAYEGGFKYYHNDDGSDDYNYYLYVPLLLFSFHCD